MPDVQPVENAVQILDAEAERYRYGLERAPEGAVVTALCDVQGEEWTPRGYQPFAVDYRLEVRLDEKTGIYRFTERNERTGPIQDSNGNWTYGASHSVQRGKFVSKTYTTGNRMSPRVLDAGGQWQQWTFQSGDVKKPLFTALRGLGWRPKHDNFLTRFFEH
jgi:hypothetical protein